MSPGKRQQLSKVRADERKESTIAARDRHEEPNAHRRLNAQRALGERLWQIRREHRWTLDDVRARTGVTISTLSKIENSHVDVGFETLMKLCDGLNLSLDHLTQDQGDAFRKNVRTVTRKDQGVTLRTATYDFEVLSTEISKKGILPTLVWVKAKDIKEFTEMNQHPGEEFIYVLRGKMLLYTEFYEPALLEAGDSAHYDSSMKHAFVNAGDEKTFLLSISHDNTGAIRGVTGHLAGSRERKGK
jgi:transcriptional regulator with XRE-family HTH domain